MERTTGVIVVRVDGKAHLAQLTIVDQMGRGPTIEIFDVAPGLPYPTLEQALVDARLIAARVSPNLIELRVHNGD